MLRSSAGVKLPAHCFTRLRRMRIWPLARKHPGQSRISQPAVRMISRSRPTDHPVLTRARACAALCRLMLMREGALKASVAILRQGGDQQLTSYALKTVTLFAQNQFRALRTFVGVCSFPLDVARWLQRRQHRSSSTCRRSRHSCKTLLQRMCVCLRPWLCVARTDRCLLHRSPEAAAAERCDCISIDFFAS